MPRVFAYRTHVSPGFCLVLLVHRALVGTEMSNFERSSFPPDRRVGYTVGVNLIALLAKPRTSTQHVPSLSKPSHSVCVHFAEIEVLVGREISEDTLT